MTLTQSGMGPHLVLGVMGGHWTEVRRGREVTRVAPQGFCMADPGSLVIAHDLIHIKRKRLLTGNRHHILGWNVHLTRNKALYGRQWIRTIAKSVFEACKETKQGGDKKYGFLFC